MYTVATAIYTEVGRAGNVKLLLRYQEPEEMFILKIKKKLKEIKIVDRARIESVWQGPPDTAAL